MGSFKLPVKVIEAVLKFQGLQKAKNISMIQLDGMCPDDKLLESGIDLLKGKSRIFQKTKSIDKKNEMRPE